ncbi:hypothetical protein DFH07DRAFT_411853 [Mycena maculata]|uniref:Uncharacterized protein n=1 Tax=Mycena maculata TaxID=230809 RepID=A0AAD7JEU1_9AGAR|nr:hypothetical protein DFH07DRAFT_411853 [Mycena maculata]
MKVGDKQRVQTRDLTGSRVRLGTLRTRRRRPGGVSVCLVQLGFGAIRYYIRKQFGNCRFFGLTSPHCARTSCERRPGLWVSGSGRRRPDPGRVFGCVRRGVLHHMTVRLRGVNWSRWLGVSYPFCVSYSSLIASRFHFQLDCARARSQVKWFNECP